MGLPRSRSFDFVVLLAACACRREEAPRPRPTPQPTTSTRIASARPVPSAPAPISSNTTPARTPQDEAALKAVRAWNDALDRHDLEKLAELYGDNVRFYGQERSKKAVLASKRAALAKQPAFRQEIIGEISLAWGGDSVRASFNKKAGTPDAFLVISAMLVLGPGAGGLRVVEESDEATARNEATKRAACEAEAAEVANALPEVKRLVAEAEKEAEASDGGARFGGLGPNDDGDGAFSASMGLHTDERFEPRVTYSVDRQGHLSVTASGSELVVPREARKTVADACRR